MKLRFTPLLALALSLAMTSCSSSAPLTRERSVTIAYADYTSYSDMWISPNQCPVAHDILGELYITIFPERTIKEKRPVLDPIYVNAQTPNEYLYEVIPYDELVGEAVKQARIKGANGISNLSIVRTGEGNWEIHGLCIVIK